MAISELILVSMMALATIATIGIFLEYGDAATRIVVGFAASILWGLIGFASYEVIIPTSTTAAEPATVYPTVYVGFGFAAVTALFAIYSLVASVGEEAKATEAQDMI